MKIESGTGAEKEGLHSEKESLDGSLNLQLKGKEEFLTVESSSARGCFGLGAARKWQIVNPVLGPILKTLRGKSEVSSVIYKVSECMQELIKLWKEYETSQSDKNSESSHKGPTLEIRIPAEHITATNRQTSMPMLRSLSLLSAGKRWTIMGDRYIYTNDSDLVAVLMHTGYFRPTASPPPPAIQELCATIRVLPSQDSYISMLRNNVHSRSWGAGIGCSYRVERCCIMKKGGGTIDLEPCLTHTSAVEPTLAPVAVERTMTTRAAALNALRQQRFVREVTIQYNLCNEPW
ncbi:hypothetical protein POTOM_058732 [Populus tomentosa]|uniref:Uncharacterized protein n=1 Tax=Populus tomentosa TaxID=118781 RepID=A0A8X7XSE9_POPTO|nr:hypothetical protein POTOM_058732 [Populus tomentosa]